MTVQNTTAKVREDGNGVKSVFSFPFKLFSEVDIEVSTIVKSTGVATLKVLNTDYSVQINAITEGGTITYLTTVPSALEEFFAVRVVPDTQPTDIPNVGSIRESQIETPLDRRTMVSQQQQEQLSRAILLASGSTVTGITIEDPEEGKGLFWVGNVLTNTDDDLNDIVSLAQAAQAAAEAAQALAETAQGLAETAQAAAEAAQTAAETAQAAAEAAATAATDQLQGTSTTSLTIGLGTKVFTTQANKFFDAGSFLLIVSDADPDNNFMIGQVTTYVGTTLTMNILKIGGSGTLADWTIRLGGSPGLDGLGTSFLDDTDTPSSYAGQATKKVVVNGAETGLEFVDDSGGATSLDVNQTTHGFAVGDLLKITGVDTYADAQADTEANAEVAGIVSAVADVDNFTLLTGGPITGLTGLTAGTVFYLSEATPALLTSTEPTANGEISKPVLIATSTTAGIFFNFRGSVIGGTAQPDIGAKVSHSANQSTSNGTPFTSAFDTVEYDTDTMTTGTANRLTVRTAGKYLVTGQIAFAAAAGGTRRQVFLSKAVLGSGGVQRNAFQRVPPDSSSESDLECSQIFDCVVDDEIEMSVLQDSGGNLNLLGGINYSSIMSAQLIA